MKTIGFILLTHTGLNQTSRLLNRLNVMFDYPPIVWHHDFTQLDFARDTFTNNITFVAPHLKTAWAEFSIVDATIKAIDIMRKLPNAPDWFIILSGNDYPIKPAHKILSDLNTSDYDAYIDYQLISKNSSNTLWVNECYERYFFKSIRIPFINKKFKLINKVLKLKYPFTDREYIFNENFKCYAGSQWFCINRRSAEKIVSFHNSNHKLTRHYRKLQFGEESYFHTILANSPDLRLKNDNLRYIDWSLGGPHPKTLTSVDIDKLYNSSDHFARKVHSNIDSLLLDKLDELNQVNI